jgi:hypothetical protein
MKHPWDALGSIAPEDLAAATLELHWAAQFIAAAGQTFVEPAADDSHRAMSWDAGARAFVSEPFAGPYPFRVALRPEDLTLMLLDRTGGILGSEPLAERNLDEGYEWMTLAMATYMGGSPPVIEPPDFEIGDHPVQHGGRFTSGTGEEFGAIAALFGSAAAMLESVTAGRKDASSIRCWPHHFDIATLLTLEQDAEGAATRTVGIGMAPMGGGYDSWYWYVTPWPYPDVAALPPLGETGAWHTEGWIGAVLQGTEVVALPADEREGAVRDFLTGAIGAATMAVEGDGGKD